MKLFNIIVLAAGLYTAPVYCQSKASTTDVYSFSKASVTVCNYSTKEVVSTHVFNDTTSLHKLYELSYPLHPVFLKASLQKGVLVACTLWNNYHEYVVQEDGRLLIPAKYESMIALNMDLDDSDSFFRPFYLSPLYTSEITGNKAIFTIPVIFANGLHDFTLEGKFVIELIKDEPQ